MVSIVHLTSMFRLLFRKNTKLDCDGLTQAMVRTFIFKFVLVGTRQRARLAKDLRRTGRINYQDIMHHLHLQYRAQIANRYCQKKRKSIPTGYYLERHCFESTFLKWTPDLVQQAITALQ